MHTIRKLTWSMHFTCHQSSTPRVSHGCGMGSSLPHFGVTSSRSSVRQRHPVPAPAGSRNCLLHHISNSCLYLPIPSIHQSLHTNQNSIETNPSHFINLNNNNTLTTATMFRVAATASRTTRNARLFSSVRLFLVDPVKGLSALDAPDNSYWTRIANTTPTTDHQTIRAEEQRRRRRRQGH